MKIAYIQQEFALNFPGNLISVEKIFSQLRLYREMSKIKKLSRFINFIKYNFEQDYMQFHE